MCIREHLISNLLIKQAAKPIDAFNKGEEYRKSHFLSSSNINIFHLFLLGGQNSIKEPYGDNAKKLIIHQSNSRKSHRRG